MEYQVIRKGKCPTCNQDSEYTIGEVEAYNSQDAISKAINSWIYDRFGQAGAIREEDILEEETFHNAEFQAIEV